MIKQFEKKHGNLEYVHFLLFILFDIHLNKTAKIIRTVTHLL